ncbi:CPBP family intramembrane metalloprotease [Erythrobacter litoralis]|uniref:CPBP family intramembrane glutamic endopeptidase n=1 Tax=Erythrobacter litoralis TaxID=39960 RepID=UPI002434F6F2|nr:type II CAAX endopeptidase family protein [Erythrobacter litoralis]MDG6079559.1 CPBP family intramembrane metalloprotease [Erythrobacter litoralis]
MDTRNEPLSPKKVLGALLAQFVVFLLLGLAIWYATDRPLSRFIDPNLRSILLGLALGGAMIAAAWLLFRLLPRIAERFIRMQGKTYGFLGDRLSLPVIVLISIGAGVGEEALFRGGLQTLTTDYVGPVGGIAIASAIFAAVHLSKPPIMAIIFGIGVLFGWVYWATGSLLIVMIAHTVYDIFALDYLMKEFRRLGTLLDPEPGDAAS